MTEYKQQIFPLLRGVFNVNCKRTAFAKLLISRSESMFTIAIRMGILLGSVGDGRLKKTCAEQRRDSQMLAEFAGQR